MKTQDPQIAAARARTMIALAPLTLLLAIPQLNDFCHRLQLPVRLPITTNHVARFYYHEINSLGTAYLSITNGMEFWYEHGIISGYRTPRSYYDLQDPHDIQSFFGPLNLTKNQAIRLARDCLLRLGYNAKEVFADQEPQVKMPPRVGTNLISYYSIRWNDPLGRGAPAAIIDLSGVDGSIGKIELFSPVFWHDPPQPATNSAADPAGPKPGSSTNIMVANALKQAREVLRGVSVSVDFDAETNLVKSVRHLDPGDQVEVLLRGGYRIYINNDLFCGFKASDCYFQGAAHERLPIESYFGKWNLTQDESLARARAAVRTSGLTLLTSSVNEAPITSLRADDVGKYVVARYYFAWVLHDDKDPGVRRGAAEVEISATDGSVKYLYVWDSSRGQRDGKAIEEGVVKKGKGVTR